MRGDKREQLGRTYLTRWRTYNFRGSNGYVAAEATWLGFIGTNRRYAAETGTFKDMVGVYESDYGVCRVILSRWVPSGKWLEFGGGVISGLFNQPEPVLSRRRRSRHDDG